MLAGAGGPWVYALYQTNVWFFQGLQGRPDRVHGRRVMGGYR